MAKAKVITKKVRMGLDDVIRYQLMTHCFVNHIILSRAEIDCLTILGRLGNYELSEFCLLPDVSDELLKNKMGKEYNKNQHKAGVFVSAQTVRNFIKKAYDNELVRKKGTSRKKIQVNPDLNMIFDGTIVLDYKLAHIVT